MTADTSRGGRPEPARGEPRRDDAGRPVERGGAAGGTRAPGSRGEAAGSAGGPGAPLREVPQDPRTGKGEDEPA